MKMRGSFYFLMFIFILMLVIISASLMMNDFEAKVMPLVFASLGLVLAAAALLREIKVGYSINPHGIQSKAPVREEGKEKWQGLLLNTAWVSGFVLSIYLFGLIVSVALFVLSYMKWLGTRWLVAVLCSVLTTAFIYGIFELALRVDLYTGLFLTRLGY